MVFSGLVTAWRLAGWPTRRSPSSVKATIEGVVRMPSALSMTLGVEPSMTATQEFVVPRSMPMTLDIELPLISAGRPGLFSARKNSRVSHPDRPVGPRVRGIAAVRYHGVGDDIGAAFGGDKGREPAPKSKRPINPLLYARSQGAAVSRAVP